jgi:hypothetical protein
MIDEAIRKLGTALRGDVNALYVVAEVIEDLKMLKREDMKREN